MSVLSIQSSVSFGHVGNSAAVPALQRLGLEVTRIDTVAFSNHPGHGRFQGAARDPAELMALLRGLLDLDLLMDCRCVVSGYLGTPDTAEVVLAAVEAVQSRTPSALYICDPVIGDEGRLFVPKPVAKAIRDSLVPRADILTPNRFELAWLTGREVDTPEQALTAARILLARGRAVAIAVTGLGFGEQIGALLVEPDAAWYAGATKRRRAFNGTGDLFTALFVGWILSGQPRADALARAIAGLDAVTRATESANRRELALVQSLDAIVDPAPAIRAVAFPAG